jgi:hypothetical protein
MILCCQRNYLAAGDKVELLEPGHTGVEFTVDEMFDLDGAPLKEAKHPAMKFLIKTRKDIKPLSIFRKICS